MKLYWRYKKDGKWTWTPAQTDEPCSTGLRLVYPMDYLEGEEE